MSETLATWLSYRPADLLMFSVETYRRLFERINIELWPTHLLLLVAVLAMLWLGRRPERGAHRAAGGLLALAWISTTWLFFGRYAEINLAAPWLAGMFAAQALALGVIAAAGPGLALDGIGRRFWWGLGLAGWGLALHPLAQLAVGRSATGVALFGLAPDPTAIATVGLLLMSRLRHPGPLLILPIAWCLVSALTWWLLLTR